jgi:hypothetical protein
MDRADGAIKQWARERPDLPSLPMAVLGRLSEAAASMTVREFIGCKMGQKLPISLGQTEKGRSEWYPDKSTIE